MKTQWTMRLSLLALALMSAPASSSPASSGQELVAAGDCAACHTAVGGKPFAGGLKMSTPVGAIYSTNITPDRQTGIGDYSYDDFAKALRRGVAKDGHHLYPAMPYTSFSKISDEDIRTLYDYFMHQVKPVNQLNRSSDIVWPLNMRWPLAVWNKIFHHKKVYQPDNRQSAQWNRGAYLVQGLGHCGACHTPRGIGFQEKGLDQHDDAFLTGGTLEDWHAPDLTSNIKVGLGRWSEQDIAVFLKTGHTGSSAAFGQMSEVVTRSTQHMSDEDLKAIAVYLKSLKSSDPQAVAPKEDTATAAALTKGDMSRPGAQEYMDNCAACHRIDGKGYDRTFPALAHNPAVLSDDPSSLISMVLRGGKTPVTQGAITGLTMPGFAWRLDDRQMSNLLSFVRSGWGNDASAVSAEQVEEIRKNLPKPEKISRGQMQ